MKKKQADEEYSRMDGAEISFARCPRCDAQARVLHVEPASGGGICRHEHRCTRCRHEWHAEPATYLICPMPDCDAHGRDRTGQICHEAMVLSLLTGPIDITPRSAQALFKEFGLDLDRMEGADDQEGLTEALAILRALFVASDKRPDTLAFWLHALAWKNRKNPAFGAPPISLLGSVAGRGRLRAYIEANHIRILPKGADAA